MNPEPTNVSAEAEKYFAAKNRRRERWLAFWRGCKAILLGVLKAICACTALAFLILIAYCMAGGFKADRLEKQVAAQAEQLSDLQMRFNYISQVASNAETAGADNVRHINGMMDLMERLTTNIHKALKIHDDEIDRLSIAIRAGPAA